MKKDYSKISQFFYFLSPMIMLAVLASCADIQEKDLTDKKGDSASILVKASYSQYIHTKVYQEEGTVTEGFLYLSYPEDGTNVYTIGQVDFERTTTPGIGVVLLPNDQDLRWENVGGGSAPVFYLDNVPVQDGSTDPMTVTFDDVYNPYKAAVFDSINGNNDFLWGTLQIERNAKNLNFSMHHNMARLKIQVTADKTNEVFEGDLDLEGATVTLSNINQTPLSYNRQTGLLELNTNPESYTILTLVDENTDWQYSVESANDPNISVFVTQNFVLPPQDLLTNEERPRLTIELASGKSFSGIIPYAMEVVNTQYPEGYPMALSFLKEYILTVRTVITEDPPQLSFMPVQVIEWVDKGEFSLDAHQAGLYTAEEFYNLIGYYQDNNSAQLVRYGHMSGSDWKFNFWAPFTLDYQRIYNQMNQDNGQQDFFFEFNGYTIFVQDGNNEPVAVSAQKLYEIVTGASTL